jgi:hypothetical protein
MLSMTLKNCWEAVRATHGRLDRNVVGIGQGARAGLVKTAGAVVPL